MRFKGTKKSLQQIAKELNVDALVKAPSPSKGLPGPKVIEVYKLRHWTSDPAKR